MPTQPDPTADGQTALITNAAYDWRVNDLRSGEATFDPTQPHISRVYDYLLGGKDNYAADRGVAERIIASQPTIQIGVRGQRAVLGRVVRYLVAEAGLA